MKIIKKRIENIEKQQDKIISILKTLSETQSLIVKAIKNFNETI